jgi:DNA-binding CsgD family transcriptional regulator
VLADGPDWSYAGRVAQPGQPEDVVPSAIISASGEIEEVNDGRGRRLLESNPRLVAYARALVERELRGVRFVWAAPAGGWHAVRIGRLPRPAGAEPAAVLEAVPIDPPHGLTARELDVLTLVAGGLSNPEIAGHLGASARTISTHVEHLLGKLGQATRAPSPPTSSTCSASSVRRRARAPPRSRSTRACSGCRSPVAAGPSRGCRSGCSTTRSRDARCGPARPTTGPARTGAAARART